MTTCEAGVRLSECIAPAFVPVHKTIKAHDATHYWLKGGRGSTKSTFAGFEVVLEIVRNPDVNGIVLRKREKRLRESVYAQIKWCISKLGLKGKFKFGLSPMVITYKPTGQTITFHGCDDVEQIKSLKCEHGYFGVIWFEELDQFAGMREVRNLRQSLMRGGDKFTVLYSYNPPRSRDSWANKEAILHEGQPGYVVHTSDYRDVPSEWLGEAFFAEADELRDTNENAYKHEYLGEIIGTGGSVFENLEVREISDDEVKAFDRTYSGVDFGWFPDPWVYERMHYDHARRILYLFDEDSATRLRNTPRTIGEDSATERIKKHLTVQLDNEHEVVLRELVTCDSAEPKSIGDYRDHGLDARPVVKGQGSVEYGMKWLASLAKIVIDPKRCPLAAVEFPLYEFERTKDGEYTSNYPDANNHSIDAVRYAMAGTMSRRFSS